jgi:type II secretory pathway component GspD/PulD (secretin)
MKVAENRVFFQLQFERTDTTTTTAGRVDTSSKILTVPVGLVMAVQPVIDPSSKRITLSVRPTISRINSFVNDPAVSIASDNRVTSQIPVVEVREIDSIVNLESGQVLLMGGLMQQNHSTESSGIPGLRDVPWLEKMLEGHNNSTDLTELVVLLKADVVENTNVQKEDIKVYEKFIDDPRPFLF